MALAIQSIGSFSSTTSGTSLTNNGLTVAAGASALLATISFLSNTVTPSGVTMTWGGSSMTQVAAVVDGTTVTQFYGLVSPPTGALTLTASWSNAVAATLEAISFVGTPVDIINNVFVNANYATGTGATASFPTTTAPGHINFAQIASNASSVTSFSAPGSVAVFNAGQVALAYDAPSSNTATWSGALTSADPFTTDFTMDFGSSVSANPWAIVTIDAVPAFTPYTTFSFQSLIAQ